MTNHSQRFCSHNKNINACHIKTSPLFLIICYQIFSKNQSLKLWFFYKKIPFLLVYNPSIICGLFNFSILYGLTPYGLSKDLGIPFKDAKKYIERYFEQYPQVSTWMSSIIEYAKQHGYVKTLFGRRRYIPTIYEKNQTMYQEACRIAVNTVAQGTAAEIMKLGMLAVHKKLTAEYPHASILLQIHDELIISAPQNSTVQIEKIVQKTLQSIVDWNVPLVVVTRSGTNWKEITK